LFVFVNNTQMNGAEVDNYIKELSAVRNITPEKLTKYAAFIKSKTVGLPDVVKDSWTAKQAYIALGNLLSAAAIFQIDTCAIEGFEADKVNRILQLDTIHFKSCVMVAIGYRSADDTNQRLPKVIT